MDTKSKMTFGIECCSLDGASDVDYLWAHPEKEAWFIASVVQLLVDLEALNGK